MEFKLPFPTLQDLAVLQITHSLMNLEVSDDYLIGNSPNSLRKSLSKVDKLEILDQQKCRIREVLKGTDDHLRNGYRSYSLLLSPRYSRKIGPSPNFLFDVYGCVDELRMARDVLQCHSDGRHDNNLLALKHLLKVALYYVLLPDIQEILPKFLKLHAGGSAVPQLNRPEFEVNAAEKLCLVYKFVDEQGILMSLNVDYDDFETALCVSNTCIHITLKQIFYNSELFQLHWNLLEPSKRIPFARSLIMNMSVAHLVHQVANILHSLDPDFRRCILSEFHDQFPNFVFLQCFLVWPYQVFLLPVLPLVRKTDEPTPDLLHLFNIIVRKLDMMAFEEILSPFWEAISSEVKSGYLSLSLNKKFENMLKHLSRKNVPMYKRVAADLNLPLTYLQESQKRKHDKSSSSDSDFSD